MRSALFLLLVACGTTPTPPDAHPSGPQTLTVPAGSLFSVQSTPAGIDCGPTTTACSAEFAEGTSVSLSITITDPSRCYFWGATVMPASAGTCGGGGHQTQLTCTVTMTEPVTVTPGGCYNP